MAMIEKDKSTHSTPRSEARGMLRVDTERRFLPRFKNRGLAPSNVSNFGMGTTKLRVQSSPACTKRSGEGREFGVLIPHSAFPACPAGRRNPQSKGVTLIEVILIMIIVGILAAFVMPKIDFTLSTTASVDGAAYMVASDIRYAQEFAMANRVSKSLILTSLSSSYSFNPNSSLDPSGQLPSGVTIGTTRTFTFNSLGEPTTGGDQTTTVTVSGSGVSKTITVVNYTGKVNITP